MSRHMQRVRVIGRDRLVLASNFQRFAFAPRDIVGVDEIMHRARMIRILFVYAEQNFGGPIGMCSRNFVRMELARCAKRRKRLRPGHLETPCRLFPWPVPNGECVANNPATPVRGKTLLRRPRKGVPVPSAVRGPWPFVLPPNLVAAPWLRAVWARVAEQSHRDAPVRHRAFGIDRCDPLKCFPRLWIGHVMKEGDRSIKYPPGNFFTGERKEGSKEVVSGVLIRLACLTPPRSLRTQ